MKALLKFRPNLQGCELEDRLVPAISNLGVIVLTTGGYVLVSPFAGVAAFPGGSPGGTPIPTSFVMTGSGISSMQPGNSTGIPALSTTAPTGSNGGSAATIVVGSGANDAGAPNIQPVTRNTIANDALVPPPRVGSVFGDRSAPLPPGQSYRGGVPVTTAGGASTEVPGGHAGRIPAQRPVDTSSIRVGSAPRGLPVDAVNTMADRVR